MSTYTGDWGEPQVVTAVKRHLDYYAVSMGSTGFSLKADYGTEPKVGDAIRQRIRGASYILGVMVNDKEVFNRSDEEDAEIQKVEHDAYVARLKEGFEKHQPKMDKDFSLLPKPFQKKIERLRRLNPNFRWQHEPYELFVCKEAMKIVNQLKSYERVAKFLKMSDVDAQQKLVPNLKYKEHTGNTFGKACQYAHFYLTNPKLFHLGHGALAELVGCPDYGCLPATDEEIAEAENAV